MAQTDAAPRRAALLSLPADMLCKIASHVVAPDLVVAAGRDVSARTALRKGTDAAERSRFGGIGLTVSEAEQVLRTRYWDWLGDVDLDSRESVRERLDQPYIVFDRYKKDHPDAPATVERTGVASQLIRTIIAYGADPAEPIGGTTPLHFVAAYVPQDAIILTKLLLAAGVDMDVEGCPIDCAGTCALSWCICSTGDWTDERCALATFLVEQGCDVVKADAGYEIGHHFDDSSSLLSRLETIPGPITPGTERLMGLISAALEAAGPERLEAARTAARIRHEAAEAEMHDVESGDY
ncbi:unnamed protein product [Pelagomonas calceolata]|uniref:Uncharacterized protein n=1 Tax=Pelagomonas calceolata TaxID=35677 RepID=A0A8J2SUD9_9STRA|nr:unnamed protein product [Pelagomonas calceolata]|mmetsp:Transcript_19128/g.54680  ORF Transcript_19128/g.54680 Transcript_19128/m.54680 type:complete len:295 (-) Transcript_19128:17-901(-)